MKKSWGFLILAAILALPSLVLAVTGSDGASGGHLASINETFLWIAIFLFLSRIGLLIEKIGQPSVLGELLIGILIGNMILFGIPFFDAAKDNQYLHFLAEFGVVLLLFRIGLESNIAEMKKVGLQAFVVATIGVVVPFLLGVFVVGELFYPDASLVTKLFIGATLTATSVGITARVFKDMGKLQIKEARIVLGAAVIDDVLGLLILAIVSSIAVSGGLDVMNIVLLSFKAFAFLILAIVIGQYSAPYIGNFLSRIHQGEGMKLTFALSFAFLIAYLASFIGLAPIVGAFAAGLILDPVHFKTFKSPHYVSQMRQKLKDMKKDSDEMVEALKVFEHRHIEDLVDSLGHIFIPLFFLITGMQVKLDVLFDPKVLLIALFVTLIAFFGKLVSGLGAFGKNVNKWLVGFGMIPRGEVGLIFVNVGKALGVVSDELFSVVVLMVLFSTIIPPSVLTSILKRKDKKEALKSV